MFSKDDKQQGTGSWWQKATALDNRLYVVYTAGIAASFSALFELAVRYGGWAKPFGITLPVVIDVYWMTALQVALDGSRGTKQRFYAAAHALFAIALSIIGNVMCHELVDGSWHLDAHAKSTLVAVIACVPVILTGTLTHLVLLARQQPDGTAVLQNQEPAVPAAGSGTSTATAGTTVVPVPVLKVPEPRNATATTAAVPTAVLPAGSQEPGTATKNRSGSGTGSAAGDNDGTGRHARTEPRKAASFGKASSAAELLALRAEVAEDLRERPRPAVEGPTQYAHRALGLFQDFESRTGVEMNAQEIAKVMRVHKSQAANIRATVGELREQQARQQEQGRQGEKREGIA